MTNTFQGKQFQSAAARRHGKPLEFSWEDWPEGATEPTTVILAVDPRADVVRMGAAFGGFATTLQKYGTSPDEADLEAIVGELDRQTPRVKKALRELLTPPSRLKFDEVSDSIDLTMLSQIVRWMMNEMSGLDPTQPNGSLNGSQPTGSDSTGGAELGVLTPPASPSADA